MFKQHSLFELVKKWLDCVKHLSWLQPTLYFSAFFTECSKCLLLCCAHVLCTDPFPHMMMTSQNLCWLVLGWAGRGIADMGLSMLMLTIWPMITPAPRVQCPDAALCRLSHSGSNWKSGLHSISLHNINWTHSTDCNVLQVYKIETNWHFLCS